MRFTRRARLAAAVAALATAVAGCSSTTRLDDASSGRVSAGGTGAGGDVRELTLESTGGPAPDADNDGVPDAAPGAGARGGAAAAGGARTGAGQGAGGRATASSGSGAQRLLPGDPIRVGWRIADRTTATAMAAALGARGVSGGDPRGYAEALVAHVNATGGIAGRKVEADYYEVDLTGLVANPDASDQESCTHFTEDAKVFTVLSPIPSGAPLPGCLASRGVPLVFHAPDEFDDEDLNRSAGFFYLPALPSMSRQAPVIVDALADQGYYQGARLGLLWVDRPVFRRTIERSLRPALAAKGVKVEHEIVMSSYTSSEQYQSAVLQFKANNITHLQIVDVSGLVAIQFMQHAESQAFRPRYGLSSANSLAAVVSAAPRAQLRRAVGVGWMPSLDVPADRDPGLTPAGKECLDVMRAAGKPISDRVAQSLAMWSCETLFFFRATMQAAPEHTPAGVRAAADRMGTSYVPVGTFATRFGPGRADGPSAARHLAFDDACGCFSYTSPPYDIG